MKNGIIGEISLLRGGALFYMKMMEAALHFASAHRSITSKVES